MEIETELDAPLKNTKRALRRHHMARLKNVRKHYTHLGGTEGLNDRQVGMVYATPAACSCMMCGNERKWWNKKTIQEQSAEQEKIDDLVSDLLSDHLPVETE